MSTIPLTDAQEMARQHPGTFEAPPGDVLAELEPGMLVKVSDGSERFWVILESVSGDRLAGVIDNDLKGNAGHGLTAGARIEFEKRHVYDIDLPTEPEGR